MTLAASFPRSNNKRPYYLRYILHCSFEMSLLFFHLPHLCVSLQAQDIGSYPWLHWHCFSYCSFCPGDRILWLLLPTRDSTTIHDLHRRGQQLWLCSSLLQSMGHQGIQTYPYHFLLVIGILKHCSSAASCMASWYSKDISVHGTSCH